MATLSSAWPTDRSVSIRITWWRHYSRASSGLSGQNTGMDTSDPLLAPIAGADQRQIGNVTIDTVPAGAGRIKRVIYPAGFQWSRDMKPTVGTDQCMHAHVGFLARGRIQIRYFDGCTVEFTAPQVVSIEPGHDGLVLGDLPAVLIEVDFERDTIQRLGMPDVHRHNDS